MESSIVMRSLIMVNLLRSYFSQRKRKHYQALSFLNLRSLGLLINWVVLLDVIDYVITGLKMTTM